MAKPTLGSEELRAALPLLYTLSAITSVCSVVLIAGGIYIAVTVKPDSSGAHDFILLGARITTTSVGLGMAFLGVVALVYLVSKLLKTMFDLTALPSQKPPSGLPGVSAAPMPPAGLPGSPSTASTSAPTHGTP